MNVVGQRLHVGKSFVGMQNTLRIALALPGVVNVDVDVAGIAHAGLDQHVGGGAHIRIGDVLGEVVPTVPAHGRRGGDGLGEGRMQHEEDSARK